MDQAIKIEYRTYWLYWFQLNIIFKSGGFEHGNVLFI